MHRSRITHPYSVKLPVTLGVWARARDLMKMDLEELVLEVLDHRMISEAKITSSNYMGTTSGLRYYRFDELFTYKIEPEAIQYFTIQGSSFQISEVMYNLHQENNSGPGHFAMDRALNRYMFQQLNAEKPKFHTDEHIAEYLEDQGAIIDRVTDIEMEATR